MFGQPLSTILWLGGGCLLLFVLIFWFYYRRRQDASQSHKEELVDALNIATRELKDEVMTLNQKHANLQSQLRGVSNHARSVEQGLGSALTAWSDTFGNVKEQLDTLYEAARARAEEEDQEEDAHHPDQDEEEEEEDQEEHAGDDDEEVVLEEDEDGAYEA